VKALGGGDVPVMGKSQEYWLYEADGTPERVYDPEADRDLRKKIEAEDEQEIGKARKAWAEAAPRSLGGVVLDETVSRAVGGYLYGARGIPEAAHLFTRAGEAIFPPSLRFDPRGWSAEPETGKSVRVPMLLCAITASDCESVPAEHRSTITGLQRIVLEDRPGRNERGQVVWRKRGGVWAGEGGGGKRMRGRQMHGACWLGGEPGRGVLLLTEGVETGWAVLAATGYLTAATISTSGLRAFVPPRGLLVSEGGPVRHVVICADHDRIDRGRGARPGRSAARMAISAAMATWARPGSGVSIGMVGPERPEWAGAMVEPEASAEAADLEDGVHEVAGPGKEEGGRKGVDWLDVVTELEDGAGRCARAIDREVAGQIDGRMHGGIEAKQSQEHAEARRGERDAEGHGGRGVVGGVGGVWDAWAPEYDDDGRLILPPQKSLRARVVLMALFHPLGAGESWRLRYYLDTWYHFDARRGVYQEVSEDELYPRVRAYFEQCVEEKMTKKGPKLADVVASMEVVRDVMASVRGIVYVSSQEMPCWVRPDFERAPSGEDLPDFGLRMEFTRGRVAGPIDPDKVMTFPSGLLDTDAWMQGELRKRPLSTRWFAPGVMPWDLPAEAADVAKMDDDETLEFFSAKAPLWTAQLDAMFEDVVDRHVLLQRYLGYSYVALNSLNKAIWIQGVPGTGKGTLMSVITAAIGEENVGTPSINLIGRPFGASVLVGKKALVFPEVRVGRHSDELLALERMLRAIGNDPLDVEDKHIAGARQVRITGKWWFTPNEGDGIRDESGAFVDRLRTIVLRRKFRNVTQGAHAEKAGLARRIVDAELPYVGLWGMVGLRQVLRMIAEGVAPGIILPQPGDDAFLLEQMREDASRVTAWAEETLVFDRESFVSKEILRKLVWEPWAKQQGMRDATSDQVLGRKLMAALGDRVRPDKVRHAGVTHRVYRGIRPRTPAEIGLDVVRAEPMRVLDWVYGAWPYDGSGPGTKVTSYGGSVDDLPGI
jgi:hypothetical protein